MIDKLTYIDDSSSILKGESSISLIINNSMNVNINSFYFNTTSCVNRPSKLFSL